MKNSEINPQEININIDDIDVANVTPDLDSLSETSYVSDSMENEIPSPVSFDEDIDEDDIAISDKKSPIVMLFGPRSSGKSMTLVRLSRYLHDNGYTVIADKTFKSDMKYREKCEQFIRNLDTTMALDGTPYTDFLLIKVVKHGTTICQFLEAPGEHYFNPKDVEAANFPPYMTEMIRNLNNRKIWVFITEAEWQVSNAVKKAYVKRIRNCKNILIKPQDRCLILYNKVDKKTELFENGSLHVEAAEVGMRGEYGGEGDVDIMKIFKNENPITSLWRPYNYKFVPFCTGYYKQDKGGLKYKKSEELYPRLLWNALLKSIKG